VCGGRTPWPTLRPCWWAPGGSTDRTCSPRALQQGDTAALTSTITRQQSPAIESMCGTHWRRLGLSDVLDLSEGRPRRVNSSCRRTHSTEARLAYVEDLGAELLELVEGGLVCDAVQEEEPLPAPDPLASQCLWRCTKMNLWSASLLQLPSREGVAYAELLLAGSVEHVEHARVAVDHHLPPVTGLDRWARELRHHTQAQWQRCAAR
jgi:hypothetical protein